MREELVCPYPNCRNIPLIKINDNSPNVNVICNQHKKHNLYRIKDYLEICNNLKKEIICSFCKKKISQNDFILYCSICKNVFDKACFNSSKCYNNSNHRKIELNINKYFDKIICIKHNNNQYSKYCKNCGISFCKKCNTKSHEGHVINDIQPKTTNEINNLQYKLTTLENSLEKVKEMIKEYLDDIEKNIKLKKLILKSYNNNRLNGNSIENLENINIPINNSYKDKINNIYNKKDNYEDKILSLYYFYCMWENEDDKDKEKLNNTEQELKNNDKKNKNNYISYNLSNLFKKKYIGEDDIDKNLNININNINNRYINNNYKQNETNVKINQKNNINISNSNNNEQKHIHKLENGPSLNSVINTITEDSKIKYITRLSSGNLAIGLLNGFIKIYNCDSICSSNNNNINSKKHLLLTIEKFKGRRINYIYELKDNSLLCCTFSRIHHIKLKNNDKSFDYLGLIKLSTHEISKKIIELGNDLIVSLGEKNYKKENIIKNKCILKIFNKINIPLQNEENNNSYLSDNDSMNSISSDCLSSSGWESLYSNEEESPLENNDEILMEDEHIKIYKKNKNYDNLYLCSIFGTKITKTKEDINLYEFIATSNKNYEEGENCVIIYGVSKNQERHGYIFFIIKTIENLSCSKIPDSICKLSKKYIGIALQKYKDNDLNGIAILNIIKKELVKVIRGFSIGFMSRYFETRNIFFVTNRTKSINKYNELRFINDIEKEDDILQCDNKKIVCYIKTRFSGIIELKLSNQNINDNSLFYYALSSNKTFYIISIKK